MKLRRPALAVVAWGLAGLAVPGQAATGAAGDEALVLARVGEAAAAARERCYPRIHHDTFEFETCLRGLAKGAGKDAPRRLGIEYFGWVGAMNSARMGMQGADDAARRFLQRLSPLQKRLRVGDAALCKAIAGDCDVRGAQLALQRSLGGKAPPMPEETGQAQ